MTARQSDFTPVMDLLGEKGTGPTRANRPIYADLLPLQQCLPRGRECASPAGKLTLLSDEDIRAMISDDLARAIVVTGGSVTRNGTVPT